MQKQKLELGLPGYSYADLYDPAKLRALFEAWHAELHAADAALGARYDAYRANEGADLGPQALSELLVELAPSVSRFVARLFRVEDEWDELRRRTEDELHVFRFKDEFVKRRALKRKPDECTRAGGDKVLEGLGLLGESRRRRAQGGAGHRQPARQRGGAEEGPGRPSGAAGAQERPGRARAVDRVPQGRAGQEVAVVQVRARRRPTRSTWSSCAARRR